MLAPDLKLEFSEQFATRYSEPEMVASLLVLAVEPEMFEYAAHAAEHLFDDSELADET